MGSAQQVTYSCIRAHADVVVVRNMRCVMTGGPQSGRVNMPFGFNITAAKTVLSRIAASIASSGDRGQSLLERGRDHDRAGVAGVQFRRVTANDNTDAGFDVRPFALMSDVSVPTSTPGRVVTP